MTEAVFAGERCRYLCQCEGGRADRAEGTLRRGHPAQDGRRGDRNSLVGRGHGGGVMSTATILPLPRSGGGLGRGCCVHSLYPLPDLPRFAGEGCGTAAPHSTMSATVSLERPSAQHAAQPRAVLLTAPLVLYMLAFYALPVIAMLLRSVSDPHWSLDNYRQLCRMTACSSRVFTDHVARIISS